MRVLQEDAKDPFVLEKEWKGEKALKARANVAKTSSVGGIDQG